MTSVQVHTEFVDLPTGNMFADKPVYDVDCVYAPEVEDPLGFYLENHLKWSDWREAKVFLLPPSDRVRRAVLDAGWKLRGYRISGGNFAMARSFMEFQAVRLNIMGWFLKLPPDHPLTWKMPLPFVSMQNPAIFSFLPESISQSFSDVDWMFFEWNRGVFGIREVVILRHPESLVVESLTVLGRDPLDWVARLKKSLQHSDFEDFLYMVQKISDEDIVKWTQSGPSLKDVQPLLRQTGQHGVSIHNNFGLDSIDYFPLLISIMPDPYRTEIGKRFLDSGVPTRYGSSEAPSPIEEWSHVAVRRNHWELLPFLQARGSDMDLPDPLTGESPRVAAFRAHRFDILDALRDSLTPMVENRKPLEATDLDIPLF